MFFNKKEYTNRLIFFRNSLKKLVYKSLLAMFFSKKSKNFFFLNIL